MKRFSNFLLFTFSLLIAGAGTQAIAGAMGGAPGVSESGRAAGRAMDDTWITTKVKSALLADRRTSGLDIQVDTDRGVVQLSGFAANEGEKQRAVELANTVEGVKDVKDDIRVSQGGE